MALFFSFSSSLVIMIYFWYFLSRLYFLDLVQFLHLCLWMSFRYVLLVVHFMFIIDKFLEFAPVGLMEARLDCFNSCLRLLGLWGPIICRQKFTLSYLFCIIIIISRFGVLFLLCFYFWL